MKNYAQFGIYDFSDFAEELESDELIFVNGGSCGGGCGGGASGGGVTTSSNSISISTCGGGTVYATGYYGTCAGGTVTSAKTYSSGVGTCGGASVPSYQTCSGGYINLPPMQICTRPDLDHCDIYAWNLAVSNGLDPRLGKGAEMDLNNQNVDTMYNSYYKGKEASFSSASAGKKGMIVYDWGGTSSAKDHIEYVEICSDGKGYNLYVTQGVETPVKQYRTFQNSPTAKADTSKGSSMVFIPLN